MLFIIFDKLFTQINLIYQLQLNVFCLLTKEKWYSRRGSQLTYIVCSLDSYWKTSFTIFNPIMKDQDVEQNNIKQKDTVLVKIQAGFLLIAKFLKRNMDHKLSNVKDLYPLYVHNTVRRRSGCRLNVLRTFNLHLISLG